MDTQNLKGSILDFLRSEGQEIDEKKRPPVVRCPSPSHTDSSPSAVVYPDKVWCPVCGENWDIFDVAGLYQNLENFKDQKEYVLKQLGITDISNIKKTTKKKLEKKLPKYKPLDLNKAREIFSPEKIQSLYSKGGELVKLWPYKDKNGLVVCVDGRFENSGGKKQVISFWYDGSEVKLRNAPDLIFGADHLEQYPDKPVLIVEGCKTATAAMAMTQFVVLTWRGGSARAQKIDWSILRGRQVFILPDDDKPGVKAAATIRSEIPDSKIVTPYHPAREIKATGADAVEYLQLMSPDELADYIFSSENHDTVLKSDDVGTPKDLPFKIMGRSGENDTFFIDRDGWLIGAPHGQYGKQFCLRLAPLNWWKFESGFSNEKSRRVYWDDVMCWLIGESNKDFDPATVRGRGAWKDEKDRTCFNDGRRIWGTIDPNCHYLRKASMNIDLDCEHATAEQRRDVFDVVRQLVFQTEMDAIRTLAWATLAPFGGALPWRSAALLTGSSGSGKSSIIDSIVKTIAQPLIFSGGESTEAGVRQAIGSDSRAVVIEEAEKDTFKKAGRREDLFSLMRQSTSNDAPIVAKGTQDGKGMSFQLRSMFLFAAISPEVEQIADDNRIFKINLDTSKRHTQRQWIDLQRDLSEKLNPRICAGIRSFVWSNLNKIIAFAKELSIYIQEWTSRGNRYALAESLFLSVYFLVYMGVEVEDVSTLENEVRDLIELAPKEETRNDAQEMIDRILQENIFVSSEKGHRNIGEICRIIGEGAKENEDGSKNVVVPGEIKDLRDAIGRHGVTVTKDGDLCIAKNHYQIMKISGAQRGYHLTLMRLNGSVSEKVCKFAGDPKRAIIIPGYYEPHQINFSGY